MASPWSKPYRNTDSKKKKKKFLPIELRLEVDKYLDADNWYFETNNDTLYDDSYEAAWSLSH